ncbi:hypothetical protein [Branchiibius cervicis]|uniref:Uncharacterized protein n=1 Tax=Branchiibius cervicis TaxID=908252 RepID=A0ABW2APS4_9MICO
MESAAGLRRRVRRCPGWVSLRPAPAGLPPQYGQQEYGQQQPPQYGQQSPPDPGQQPPTQQ